MHRFSMRIDWFNLVFDSYLLLPESLPRRHVLHALPHFSTVALPVHPRITFANFDPGQPVHHTNKYGTLLSVVRLVDREDNS